MVQSVSTPPQEIVDEKLWLVTGTGRSGGGEDVQAGDEPGGKTSTLLIACICWEEAEEVRPPISKMLVTGNNNNKMKRCG